MSASPKQLEMVGQWMTKADHDLLMAEHALTLKETECPFDMVCYHAQQAVEKQIKALLIFNGIPFPRTHDLAELAALMPPLTVLSVSRFEITSLTPYAVQARYPGVGDEQTYSEAIEAVRIARELREAVKKLLPAAK